ncbi:MAG: nucleoside triphosphate pyrophosphohydrolase [Bacteroidales bacterium]|nr:nucleoside triphosphate pyrophosphohydrolase [Bacteroidales bacterium]
MNPPVSEEQKSFAWLSCILDTLRQQCPWDSKQTPESLRHLTIEEIYELSEALLEHDTESTRKELGDILMHVIFYSKLFADAGAFTTVDMIDNICRKLISRHPHISLPDRDGIMQAASTLEAPQWEQVKMKENRRSVLEGVPHTLPPLVKAVRMHNKVAGVGFDFESANEAKCKVDEEYRELQEALCHPDNQAHVQEEFGDLLFALVVWGNHLGVNADDALSLTINKFRQRFAHVEQTAISQGRTIADLSPDEMLALWQEAKKSSTASN